MIDPALLLAAAIGAGLGVLYVHALWRGTTRLAEAASPVRAALLGAGIRIVVLAGGFAAVGAGDPVRLLAAVAGFFVVRYLAVRRVRRSLDSRASGRAA